jgi:translation initiation factor 2B subunit (eIF-2B alpha/beta/delta family)
MPCRDYEPSNTEISDLKQINRQAEKLDHLTALLCKASQMLIKAQPTSSEAQDVFAWYEEHRSADIDNMKNMLAHTSDLGSEFFTQVSIEDFDLLDAILNKILKLR